LIVNNEGHDETTAGRAVRTLASALRNLQLNVVIAATSDDALATINADAPLHAAIVDWDLGHGEDHSEMATMLAAIRAWNATMPIFLLAERSRLSGIPVAAIQQADDFIWLLEDTVDFIADRVQTSIRRYQEQMLPRSCFPCDGSL
jgi:arginine decarboxylase